MYLYAFYIYIYAHVLRGVYNMVGGSCGSHKAFSSCGRRWLLSIFYYRYVPFALFTHPAMPLNWYRNRVFVNKKIIRKKPIDATESTNEQVKFYYIDYSSDVTLLKKYSNQTKVPMVNILEAANFSTHWRVIKNTRQFES